MKANNSAPAKSAELFFRWMLVAGLLLAVAGTSPAAADDRGRRLYLTNCSSCHGLDMEGTAQGPPLQRAGAAAFDFMLSTGRMPLADYTAQEARQPPKFSEADIRALTAFATASYPGGPPIPRVDASAGNLRRGRELYATNCQACHSAGGIGASVGYGQYAPSLANATAIQVAEAVRVGPGQMPRFDNRTLSARDLQDVVRYVGWLQTSRHNIGGLSLGDMGPVAEGFVALVFGLGFLLLVVRYIGTTT